MKVLGNLSDWFRNHKVIGLSIGLIILGVIGVVLYTSIRTTSDRAITSGQKELATQTEDVEKAVKKESKDLKFNVPMVEDVADAITKQEDLDGELDLVQKYEFVKDEYGEDVYNMSIIGYLPSRSLTVSQNRQQLDSIKQITLDGYTENEGAWVIDTSSLLYEDEGTISAYPKLMNLTAGYTLENQSQFFNIGDYSVGGFHVNTTNSEEEYGIEGYTTNRTVQGLQEDYNALGETVPYIETLSNDSTVTVITYFVRANKNLSATNVLKDVLDIDLALNGTKTGKFTKEENNFLTYNEFFGDLGSAALVETEVQESNVFMIRQYISGNSLKDTNNKISIAGTEYNLKKVSVNEAIDLTNTYSE